MKIYGQYLFGSNPIKKDMNRNKKTLGLNELGFGRFQHSYYSKYNDFLYQTSENLKLFLQKHQKEIENFNPLQMKSFNSLMDIIVKQLPDKVHLLGKAFENNNGLFSFLDLITRFNDEKTSFGYLEPLLNYAQENIEESPTNYKKIHRLLDFRLKALEHRKELSRYGTTLTRKNIDELLIRFPLPTAKTLDLIGEEAFLYSFKDKIDNVVNYITELGVKGVADKNYIKLQRLINPKATEEYKNLLEQISSLKSEFTKTNNNEEKENLKKLINTATYKKNTLLKNAIKDPKDILETALIAAAMDNNGLQEDTSEMLELLNNKNREERNKLNQFLHDKLYKILGLGEINPDTKRFFDFSKSKYLAKLFYSKRDFKLNIQELVKSVDSAPHPIKNLSEVFDNMYHNKLTRQSFEKLGLNYDAWSKYNHKSKIDLDVGSDTIRAQKVNMNNIPHSIFLGEHSSCCTKINGSFARSAVPYISSKMIQAIEVYHNDIPIANTMCYIAKVNNVTSLILDNIEVKPQYENNDLVQNITFDYAKKLVSEIGAPQMPIFLSSKRNDINTDELKSSLYSLSIVGDSGKDMIYIDFVTNDININNATRDMGMVYLYKVSGGDVEPLSEKTANQGRYNQVLGYYRNYEIDPNFD